MKKRFGMMLLCAGIVFSTVACDNIFDPGKDVKIVYSDGTSETIHYKKGKFEYTPAEKNGYYFMGCFAEQSLKSTKYVNYDAKRLNEAEDLPETIYAMYVKADGPQIIDFTFDDQSTSSSIKYNFNLDEAYQYYFGKKDYIGYLSITFKHYEKESGAIGINLFHWADYSLKTPNDTLENGAIRSNGGYSTFNRMYKIEKGLIFNDLSFNIVRPSACASSENTKITSFKATLYFGEEADISQYKYANLFDEGSSQNSVTMTFEDNSSTLNNSYSVTASMKYTFPFNLKEWIAESKTSNITFTLTTASYGAKTPILIASLSNWVNGSFTLSSDYKKSVHLESNSDYTDKSFSVTVPLEDAIQLSSATLSLEYPSGNQSQKFYYVRNTRLTISRV